MIKIRRNVFETNSSSTHSMCICNDATNLEKCNLIIFMANQFGWEVSTINTPVEKASYIYTLAFAYNDVENFKSTISKYLDEVKIDYAFKDITEDDYCYVDHSENAIYFYQFVLASKDNLLRYLLSSKSFILTGNDNIECDVEINVDYDYDEFYKGN